MDIFIMLFAVFGGVFTIFCSYKDYDWFFNNYRARPFVALFGRNGARIFYYILGIILIILGFVLMSLPAAG